jgi:hypothetical protein
MAYANKYKITFATKTSKTAYLYLQEDGYSGTVYEYPGKSLQLQYLPQSDDPFEPIFASQLSVTIDVTDDLANMPNLVTMNDKKYFAKLLLNTDVEWVGYALSDSVDLSFSTGRKELSFDCVDGLGMLQDVPLPIPDTTNINLNNNLIYFIALAFNQLTFPTTPNIRTACNFYATGMTNRGASGSADPFDQTYLPYRTFVDENYSYLDCFNTIRNIVQSLGCRVFQAGGKWWIVSINQFANENVAYSEYDYTGTLSTSGTFNTLSTIQGYSGNTSGLFFVDNSQTKLFRKGYNRVQKSKRVEMSNNYISNGNLRPLTSGSTNRPQNWTVAASGTGASVTYVSNPNDTSAIIYMDRGSSGGYANLKCNGLPKVNGQETLKFSWTYRSQDFTLNDMRGFVYLTINDGLQTYYYDGDAKKWRDTGGVNYYQVPPQTSGTNSINEFSFSVPSTPIAGQLGFEFWLQTISCRTVAVSDFRLEIGVVYSQVDYAGYLNNSKQYVKDVEIAYGYYSPYGTYPTEAGIFLLSDGSKAADWYQYGKAGTYPSLAQMLMQQYMNVYGKNIINIDCSLTSFATSNGILNGSKLFKATDTDPAIVNVQSYSYMLGNATIDYVEDTTQATLLQISDTTITATTAYEVAYNQNVTGTNSIIV